MPDVTVLTQSRNLLNLAPELIEAISENLDLESVKQFRLTCRSLGDQLTNAVLRTILIDITRNNFESGLSKLAVLAKAKHAACTGTRTLFIHSLAPSYDPDYHGPSWTYVDGEWKAEAPPEDPPEIALAENEMETYLYDAIASFKGVQNVTWMPCVKDREQPQQAVLNALKTLPNLRRLRINLYSCKIPVDLDAFKCLHEISIEETSSQYQKQVVDGLAKLVAHNPDISSINLSNSWGYRCSNDGSQSLHQLFKYYPAHAPPMRLRHLGLQFCLMRLDEITLPHLKNLTSLDIISIEDPYSDARQFSDPNEEASRAALNEKKKQFGSSLEDIWKALRASGIHLEEIALDVVPHSFVDYLSSYTGLRKLRLSPGGFSNGVSSEEMAKRFFADAFMIHASSLEYLHISPRYEGLWCFGSHNMEMISRCTKLKTMRLGVFSSQLGSSDDDRPSSSSNALKLVIDMAVTSMPHIEDIHISGANLEQLRWARCGNPAMSHFTHVNAKLEKCVYDYRAPLSCNRLPTLRITNTGRRAFVGSHVQAGTPGSDDSDSSELEGPLRYIDVTPPIEARQWDW